MLDAVARVHFAYVLGGLGTSSTRENALRSRIAYLELCLGEARSPDVQALLFQMIVDAEAALDREHESDEPPFTN